MAEVLTPPAHLWVPDHDDDSYASEVADLAELAGRTLDAEQKLAVSAATARRGGRWAALEFAVVMPRQNGKTGGIILPVALADLFLTPWPVLIVWSSHKVRTTKEAFLDIKRLIQSTPELDARVAKISEGRGEEGVTLTSGSRLNFLARINGGGRGLSGDSVALDEALFLTDSMLGDLLPTMAARRDPHVLYGSSAGKAASAPLRALRDRGRKGGDQRLAYVEWSSEPACRYDSCTHARGSVGCSLDDLELLQRVNPASRRGRIDPEFLLAMRRSMSPQEFGREFAGWWDDPATAVGLTVEAWARRAWPDPDDSGVPPKVTGRPVFALDVAPHQRFAAVGVAGVNEHGELQLELVEHRGGTSWVVDALSRLAAVTDVVVNPGAAVSALIPDLRDAGLSLVEMSARDVGQACGMLQAAVAGEGASRPIVHLNDPMVSAAISGAATRDVGDGLWAWSHRRSEVDITPITSLTWAHWWAATDGGDYDLTDSFG